MKKIKPIKDFILIEPILHLKSHNILIPETIAEDYYREGKVIAIGPGRKDDKGKRIPMEVKIGDKVILGIGGYDLEIDGKKFYMVREKHIKAILNEA